MIAVISILISEHVGSVVLEPFRLWARWFSGDRLDTIRLWGWPMLAWGRTGKVLQFAAGLTVLLDLIGPDRLRAFGGRLRGLSWQRFVDRMEGPVMVAIGVILASYYLLLFAFVVARNVMSDLGVSSTLLFGPVGAIAVLLSFFGVGFLLLRIMRRNQEGGSEALRVARRLPALIVGLAPIAAWVALSRGLLLPAVNGLASAFDRTHPGYPLRWTAFIFFIVGFQFDLLAS